MDQDQGMTKAERALVEMSNAMLHVRLLGRAIGAAMAASYDAQTANGGEYTDWIKLAYSNHVEHDDLGRAHNVFDHHDGDAAAYLAQHCKHALRAHELIQERKAANKRLGIARRRVTVIANALASKSCPAT